MKTNIMNWINAFQHKPKEDEFLLLCIKNVIKNSQTYKTGTYIKDKFYAKGGLSGSETVTFFAYIKNPYEN